MIIPIRFLKRKPTRIIMALLVTVLMFSCVSCKTNNYVPPSSAMDQPQYFSPGPVDIEEMKRLLMQEVNDDIWYHGKDSDYFNFQNRKVDIELYIHKYPLGSDYEKHSPTRTLQVGVYVKQPFVRGFDRSNVPSYYLFLLEKLKGGYFISTIKVEDSNQMIEDFLQGDYWSLVDQGEIDFPSVSEPVYPPPSPELEAKYELLKRAVIKELENGTNLSPKSGEYTLIFIPIRVNCLSTSVILETPDGKRYNFGLGIDDDNYVSVRQFYKWSEITEIEYQSNYWVNKVRQNGIRKTFTIEG